MSDMRELLDSKDYFGALKMCKDGPQKDQIAIVVEGHSDEVLYRKMLCQSCVFFSTDGWENAEKVIQDVEKHKIEGVVGILDADFRRILPKSYALPNTFFTDGHDLEIMMANSQAWEGLIHQHCQKSKLEKFENDERKPILDVILGLASEIAVVRFLNYRDGLGLKFKSGRGKETIYLKFSDFIDKKSLNIDSEKLLKTVENKSSKPGMLLKNPTIQKELNTISNSGFDKWDFSNGHDLLNILSLALKSAISNKDSSTSIPAKDLETQLSIAYRFSDFQKTQLYKDLLAWESMHSPKYALFCS